MYTTRIKAWLSRQLTWQRQPSCGKHPKSLWIHFTLYSHLARVKIACNMFTIREDEELTKLVKKHRCLYDKKHMYYNNNRDIKYKLWVEIANQIGKDGKCILFYSTSTLFRTCIHIYLFINQILCTLCISVYKGALCLLICTVYNNFNSIGLRNVRI